MVPPPPLRGTSPSPTRRAGEANLYIFARFHAREGMTERIAAAMDEMLPPVRAETGCISINVFRSLRDGRLFYVHSRWLNEAAFELHATLPHTLRFIEMVKPLIDHPPDVVRAMPLESDPARSL
jgi:quinol monooxygenase YgiN